METRKLENGKNREINTVSALESSCPLSFSQSDKCPKTVYAMILDDAWIIFIFQYYLFILTFTV